MNINPKAIRILCYGDSLTFGHDVETDTRFNALERWTGILQKTLGVNYEIIEEGLGGRTTDIDDPKKHNRGKKDAPCAETDPPPARRKAQ